MKYMTYDLLVRTQSNDEDIAEEALAEWDRACEHYNNHIEEIRLKLPKSVQALLDSFSLHDAKFAAFGTDKEDGEDESLVFIDLQLESPRTQGLRLEYKLAGKVKAVFHAGHPRSKAELLWLYDEIDAVEVDLPGGGQVAVLTHAILLSEGLELQLPFHGLHIKPYQSFLSPVKSFRPDDMAGARELLLT
jgi:hypothetical protein